MIAMAIMVFPWGCSRLGSGPGAVVEKYCRSLASGKTDEAAGFLYSRARTELTASRLEARMQEESLRVRQRQGISSISIKKETPVEGNPGTTAVDVDIAYGNGDVDKLTYGLIQESGNWRISVLGQTRSDAQINSTWHVVPPGEKGKP
jgi:hypothetical protein